MSKTMIVAKREFVENLRTKTFWIGIFALPVIFALSIFVGRVLEESKDVRKFAVYDQTESRWLSSEVEARAARTDLNAITQSQAKIKEAGGQEAEAAITEWHESLAADHPIRDLVTRLKSTLPTLSAAKILIAIRDQKLPPEGKVELIRWAKEAAFDPSKTATLKAMASGIALARYRQLPLEDFEVAAEDGPEEVKRKLNDAVLHGRLFAYLVVPPDPVASTEGAGYVSNNTTDADLREWFEGHSTEVVRARRIDNLNLTPKEAATITASFEFPAQSVSTSGATETVDTAKKAANYAPVAFVYLLWIAVFTAAQMLLTNTVEEKSNRLIEVLLSSVTPLQLMSGKVIGIAATGLTIVLSWVLTGVVGARLVPETSGLAELGLNDILSDPLYLGSFVVYFLAGYLLYAAILVALGSVCDSLKEAQNLLQPVFILLIVPLIAMFFVVKDPNGAVARMMTYIPLYTPFLMMNRASGPPPMWEYVASSAVIVVSLILAFWAAGKIFRVGILMTGKPPKIMEILRWLRAPVGAVHVKRSEADPQS